MLLKISLNDRSKQINRTRLRSRRRKLSCIFGGERVAYQSSLSALPSN